MMLRIWSSFILQMLGCSLNLFMMLSIWNTFFYFANARVVPSIRVFLEFIYDVGYMVLLLSILQMLGCSLNLFMVLSIWSFLFILLQMLGCSFNLFMMLSIWSSFFYFPNARVFLEFIYDVEHMVFYLLFCKC